MSTPRFDLVDVAKTIQARKRFILLLTLLAAVIGTIVYLIIPRKYQTSSEILISNPSVADRNYIFRSTEPRYIDFFAGEDDIDHVMAIAFSEKVRNQVIQNQGLYKAYNLNEADLDDQEKMGKRWKKHYDVTRTEYKNIELSYKDTDPKRAASVANDAVRVIENIYRGYYNSLKDNIKNSLQTKINEADSAIVALTDTVGKVQDRLALQNLETIRVQYLADRTKYISLMNEFSTATADEELNFFHVISPASPPKDPAGLGMILSVVACAFVGFFAAVIIALMSAYFKALTSVSR